MTARQAGFWKRHRWVRWTCFGLLAALAMIAGAVVIMARRAEPVLRARIVQGLEDRFHARVELDSFHLTLRDGLWADGKGLRIWPPAQVVGVAVPGTAVPAVPLIRLDEFQFHVPFNYRLGYKPGQAIHVSAVQLKGLKVDVPPRSHFEHGAQETKGTDQESARQTNQGTGRLRFQVVGVECTGAQLTIETSKPGKLPLQFAIAHLKLTGTTSGIGVSQVMSFDAELTNPRPVGTIHTTGRFGPWVVEDPGESPITGDYRFERADLSGFKGIAGILSSTGHYEGTLRNLEVDGVTETPDFRLTHFGTAVPLHTKFHARVDGTNGDTWLEPVEATLGNSHFWARGQIVRVAAVPDGKGGQRAGGHDIALTVNVDRGRIEDFLRLASKLGSPLLTGALSMKAGLEIRPGPVPIHERLKLTGTFDLNDVQVASAKIQDRIAELSARGLGRPKDAKSGGDVRSTMKGNFQMAGGVVTLPALEYTVPGAVIDLKGSYGVEG